MQDSTQFSIVVAGAMNPKIHHPTWYRQAKILTKREEAFAIKSQMVCVSELAQFTTERFGVTCDQTKWLVQTPNLSLVKLLKVVAIKVFDRLPETPLTACGINVDYHIETETDNVGSKIGRAIASSNLGLVTVRGEEVAGRIVFSRSTNQRKYNIVVEQSLKAKNGIFITVNVHYDLHTRSYGRFKEKLNQYLNRDIRMVDLIKNQVLSSFRK